MSHLDRIFDLSVDTRKGVWTLASADEWVRIGGVSVVCSWHEDSTRRDTNTLASAVEVFSGSSKIPFDPSSARQIQFENHKAGVTFSTKFVLSTDSQFLLMMLQILNRSRAPIYLDRVDFMNPVRIRENSASGSRKNPSRGIAADREDLRFLAQGWQSWSYTGLLGPRDRFPRSRLAPLSGPMQLCWGLKHPSRVGQFISDFYGAVLDTRSSRGLLLGFLSQVQAFGRFEVDFNSPDHLLSLWQNLEGVQLLPGETFTTDWACIIPLDLAHADPLGSFLALVAAEHGVIEPSESVSGWCSWYCYGQDISIDVLGEQLDWLRKNRSDLPLNLFQIDDGYQQNIGDWDQNESRFPEPLSLLADRIHGESMMAGVWLAPLIALPGSSLYRDHPDWFLKQGGSRPVNAGYGWGRFFKALDGSHPEVQDAIQAWTDRAIHEWGFDYLKLDFLYAGALLGERYDAQKTGAMVLRDVLSLIRETAGDDTFLVGCGCPLGSGVGLVDSMRISPDVSTHWKGQYKSISVLIDRDPGFPSAWNAIRNTYFRANLHRRWWLNDPDCLILRQWDSSLTEDEVQTLATMVAMCGGVVIDSDSLVGLTEQRFEWLARLVPPINQRPVQPTIFGADQPALLLQPLSGPIGRWTLAAIFNFDDITRSICLDCKKLGFAASDSVRGFDVWEQAVLEFSGSRWDFGNVPAHGVRLLAVRTSAADKPQWIGDTVHISQGLAVEGWEHAPGHLSAGIAAGRTGSARIWLGIRGKVRSVIVDDAAVSFDEVQRDTISFEIQLEDHNRVHIEWD